MQACATVPAASAEMAITMQASKIQTPRLHTEWGAHSNPSTWTLNTATSNGHMLLYVNLGYTITINSWSQMGFGIGFINQDIGSSNSRNPYAEFVINRVTQVSPGGKSQIFPQSIPNGDLGYLEAWTYLFNQSNGTYTAKGEAYSPIWANHYIASANMGPSLRSGPVSTSIEAQYINYNSTCDNYSQYTTTSGALYTTAVQGDEPINLGSAWLGCTPAPNPANPPYSVSESQCWSTVQYWGG
jgi:hypothetical protein